MKVFISVIRYFVGIVFIISGLIKANDPLGLSYKMQEFFEAWNLLWMHDYTLLFSIAMNVFEVVAGFALIIGWRFKLVSSLVLLLTIFFTFLTGYALFSGKIATCGCFGDCVPLQPAGSFIKDIVLLICLLLLLAYSKLVHPFFSTATGIIILISSALLTIFMQWYVLKHLPFMDCLPYKKGNDLLQQMKVPEGAMADSFAITFRYKKEGKIIEFDADNFPEDFDEPPYEYIDRYDKLIRKGNARPAISDFNLVTLSGNDTTTAILSSAKNYLLVFIKSFDEKEKWMDDLKTIKKLAAAKNLPLYIVTSDAGAARKYFDENLVLICDGTAIKTAARANPTYIFMQGATVQEKISFIDIQKVEKHISEMP